MCKMFFTILISLCLASGTYGASMTIVDLPATGTDAAIGINQNKTYTHAFDFGSNTPTVVNGVVLEQGPTANLSQPFVGVSSQGYGYTIDDTRASVSINVHAGNDPSSQADGDSAEMLRDMMYFASADVDEGIILTLSDLTPGFVYSVRYYFRLWDGNRPITIRADGESDGDFSDTIDIDIDQGGAHYLDYTFIADDDDVTLEFITNVDNQGVHLYGITCEGLGLPGAASRASPAHDAMDVFRDTLLTWTPGENAVAHDVYFGTDFDDVNDGVALVSPGQDASSYDPGRLEFGQTYFWRVDEVTPPPESELFKGDVWSFTTEPVAYPIPDVNVTASIPVSSGSEGPERTADGSGLIDGQHSTVSADMWLGDAAAGGPVWLRYDFGRVYKLHDVHIWNHNSTYEEFVGFGVRSVTIEYATDTDGWTVLGDFEIARAPGLDTYAGMTIDLGGIIASSVRININSNWSTMTQYGLAEVRFSYIPLAARKPNPASGATDVSTESILSWRPGREAGEHKVYFSADEQAVMEGTAPVEPVGEAVYRPSLDLSTTYYWRVDEVNEAMDPSVWAGSIWSLATVEKIVVDDFESYDDAEGQGTRIYESWTDGYGAGDNGSQVGHDDMPFAEQTIVHSGSQSMPLYYEGADSHADLQFDNEDWTRSSIKTLSIAFHGTPGNTGRLYARINGVKVNYDQAATDIANPSWLLWQIDLTSISGVGSVTQLSIGVEDSVGQGLVYIDDVELYGQSPQTVAPVAPGSANLVARYAFDGDLQDAQGTHHGSMASGSPLFDSGYQGQALDLGGAQEVVVPYAEDLGMSSFTVTAWVNVDNLDAARGILGTRFGSDYTFDVKVESDRIHGDLGDGSSWINSSLDLNRGILTETWHHIAYVIDAVNQEAKIYLNGSLVATYTIEGTPLFMKADQELHIGNSYGVEEFMVGLIDEVALYDRVLSDAEVAGLAGRTMPIYVPF